jgi:hypothetical protein
MRKFSVWLLYFLCNSYLSSGQHFLETCYDFSHQDLDFITFKNGSVIIGTMKDTDRKKGLIEHITIEDSLGRSTEYAASDIRSMYLAPSAYGNLIRASEVVTDAHKWDPEIVNQELINKGYVYFENIKTDIKNAQSELMMQLINPSFCDRVKVFADPKSQESGGLSMGGIQVTGGEDKSYYVHIDDQPVALRLYKKDYKDLFKELWSDCPSLFMKYPKPDWDDLIDHILEYNKCD